jgi:phage shock protein A
MNTLLLLGVLCAQLWWAAVAYKHSQRIALTQRNVAFAPRPKLFPIAPLPSSTYLSFIRSNVDVQPHKSTRLYVFDRLIRLIMSNINGWLKQLEDPEKIIEQAVTDMQNDLVRVRQSYAEVTATQKRFEKQRDSLRTETDVWYRRAQTALQKGDEALAREALHRKNTQKELIDSLSKQIAVQEDASDKLHSSMVTLEAKIIEAKRQKEGLIARARTAKTSLQVHEMLNSLTTTSSSMEAFTRMKDKVDSLETQAEITGEMSGVAVTSLEDKFKAYDEDSIIDAELVQMRNQLPGQQKAAIYQLPADLDAEYEALKRELRK